MDRESGRKPIGRLTALTQRFLFAALCLAATATFNVTSVPVAEAVCCVCSCGCTPCGSCSSPGCCGSGGISTAMECANVCATTCSGTMLRFSADADCSGGVADACEVGENLCIERTNGGSFCNTQPTHTPTPTFTETPTETPTVTATVTATATNTPIPNGGACTEPTQCASENCVDGACCAEASCPAGQSCNNPGRAGTCTSSSAVAPVLSRQGILAIAVLLLAVGALTVRRARR